jgi:hypothetical protein
MPDLSSQFQTALMDVRLGAVDDANQNGIAFTTRIRPDLRSTFTSFYSLFTNPDVTPLTKPSVTSRYSKHLDEAIDHYGKANYYSAALQVSTSTVMQMIKCGKSLTEGTSG